MLLIKERPNKSNDSRNSKYRELVQNFLQGSLNLLQRVPKILILKLFLEKVCANSLLTPTNARTVTTKPNLMGKLSMKR